jgi:uncharacterized protein (DUF2252 family)
VTDSASVQERAARGRAARRSVPRSAHAGFEAAADRPDPVALLERQAADRVPELVPIRYGRMLVSPFTFFRGSAAIMASDLARTPDTGIVVQCCGDAHLSNFGVFASPERRLVFDLNDFDETLRAPWEWDLKRLTASMAIAARENGFARKHQDAVVAAAVSEYRMAMTRFAGLSNLEVWYARLEIESLFEELRGQLTPRGARRTGKELAKARTRDSTSAFAKLAHVEGEEARIVADPPLIVPIADLVDEHVREQAGAWLHERFAAYRATLAAEVRVLLDQYRPVDVAHKVVGVGSVGTRAWIVLLLGRDRGDPLFLQLKEAQPSVLEAASGRCGFDSHGERVVTGQRVMQASSDIFLGWLTVPAAEPDPVKRDFYGRQLRDWKGSAEVERMLPEGLAAYGRLCGWTLARAHARSGDRIAIAAYLGRSEAFDRAIVEFAHAYADQNERDYKALQEAARSGRIEVESGV